VINFAACTDHTHPHPHVQGQNIYQTQQQMVPPHYKQYNPNVSFTENLPPPPVITTAAHQPQTISGNPTYTQQQQIYIQQQQIYAQQQQQYQTLRRKQQQAQQQAQAQGQLPPQQQIYQPNPNQQQLPPPPQVTQIAMQQQQAPPPIQQQQQQPQIPPHTQQQYVTSAAVNYTPAPPSATMAVVTGNNVTYVQASQPQQMDSNMMYDRGDKQIYKCSTLGRYGGKYDGQRQQNLVPAVIPTVPQIPKYNNNQQQQQPQVTSGAATIPTQMIANSQMANSAGIRPAIQNCPLPDIPSVGTFKGNVVMNDKGMVNNDLPHTR
jgi:hypothetical protein